jgi:hypothetical protein
MLQVCRLSVSPGHNRGKLPPGYLLGQADGTGWVATFSRSMPGLAIILAQHNPAHEDVEYFHDDTGRDGGASHKTGWTGLIVDQLIRFGNGAPL